MRIYTLVFLTGLLVVTGLIRADDSWMLYDDSQVALVHIEIDPAALQWIYENPESDSMHIGLFHFQNAYIDEWVEDIGFRIRGNTSRGSAKKSFKVSFNTFVPGRQFYDVDKMNLNGEHNDPSIVRSKLCWDFFQKIGLTASRACHAAVYINDVYYGLYISVEHIDDEFVQNHFSDDTGNLWKCLWPADLTYRGDDPASYHPYFDDERPYELKTNNEAYDYSKLAELIDVINNSSEEEFADSLENILYVTEVLKYFAANVLMGGWDDYWFLMNNYYLYHEPSVDKFHWIPYDYDNTFGVDWFDTEWSQIDPYTFAVIDDGPRPLATRIMANEDYRNLYTHFLEFYNEHVFQWFLWESECFSLRDTIAPWAEMDIFRTMDYGFDGDGGMNDFLHSYDQSDYSNQHVKQSIKTFVSIRNATLPGQLYYTSMSPMIYDVSYIPEEPQSGDSISVSASVFDHEGLSIVQLSISFEGAIPILSPMSFVPVPSTQKVEEADRYVGTIPPLSAGESVFFRIEVEDHSGHTSSYPRDGFIEIRSSAMSFEGLKINEFMAKNDTTIADEYDEYDDWIEIYNSTTTDVFMSGMYLTDASENLTKWHFPFGDVILEAGGYLLVWCDDEEEQGPLHTNFKLDADGEYIALVADDGVTVIDSLTFGPQSEDISYGRYPDGNDFWMFFPNPTPGSSNIVPMNLPPVVTGTSHAPGRPSSADSVLVISKVTDESGLISVILKYKASLGYQNVSMWDDGEHGDGAAGDSVYGGYIPPQADQITVNYYIRAEDDSSVITLDPEDAPATTYSYIVGYAPPPIFINEFMADNDNGIQDEAEEYDDWIELYNADSSDVYLGGMYLTDDLTDPTQWQIPDTTIATGGVLLFWADDDEEQGPLHTNFKLSKDGEEIGLFDTDGLLLIDSISFDSQSTDISFGRCPDGSPTWTNFENPTPGDVNAQFDKGDVSSDGQINILDVLAVVNHILGIQFLEECALYLADCSGDGEIDILDVVGIVNVILGIGECVP